MGEIINRDGLYEINDESYLLFKEIETVMQAKLRTHLQQGVDGSPSAKLSGREEILEIVKNDIKVLFYWDILSKIIKDEEFKMELLTAVIHMWLTIRGYSITSQWMEQYKQLSCVL